MLRRQFSLGTALDSLVSGLDARIRNHRNVTLWQAIDVLLDKHHGHLVARLQLPAETTTKQRLWEALSQSEASSLASDTHARTIRRRHIEKNALSPDKTVEPFIKHLYPLQKSSTLPLKVYTSTKILDWSHNVVKYENINHNELYRAYTDIPVPRPYHLKSQQFEDLVAKFLQSRNFVKPNNLSLLYVQLRSPGAIIEKFHQMIALRRDYLKMATALLNDVKKMGPLTVLELNRLLYYTFFRDKPLLLRAIEAKVDDRTFLQAYPELSIDIYRQLGARHTSTRNILLFHAFRHGSDEIVVEIMREIEPNYQTVEILADHGLSEPVMRHIERLPFLSIKLVNKVIKQLVGGGDVALAEKLVSSLSNNDNDNFVYKQLTPEDRHVYGQLMTVYDNLRTLTGEAGDFQLVPTENTYRYLVEHYCSDKGYNFDDVVSVLEQMHQAQLPVSTRIYKHIYTRFADVQHPSWNFKALVELTSRMVYKFDAHDELLLHHSLLGNHVHGHLERFISENAYPAGTSYSERGAFLKLSDELIAKVYAAFVAHAGDGHQVHAHKEQLDLQLQKVRVPYVPGKEAQFRHEEEAYIKKGFLIDLISVATT